MVDGSAQYYYLDAARTQQGPVSGPDMARLARSGAITRETMIWCAGMPDWRPVGQINELASLFGPPPGSPPPMRPPMPPAGRASMRAPGPAGGFGAYEPQPGEVHAGKSMGLVEAVSTCLRKYADFNGRAARPEFWFFALFQFLLFIGITIVGGLIAVVLPTVGSLLITVCLIVTILGLFLPGLAVSVRRLHDTDRSGWWLLIGLVPFGNIVQLIFMCLPGTPGANRFGP